MIAFGRADQRRPHIGPPLVRGGVYAAWKMRSEVIGDGLNPLTVQ